MSRTANTMPLEVQLRFKDWWELGGRWGGCGTLARAWHKSDRQKTRLLLRDYEENLSQPRSTAKWSC
jgi:hypothetical protein